MKKEVKEVVESNFGKWMVILIVRPSLLLVETFEKERDGLIVRPSLFVVEILESEGDMWETN